MKIAFIHGDPQPWATTHRCNALKKRWTDDEVDLYYVFDVVNNGLTLDEYDIIQIQYSGGITMLKDLVNRNGHKCFGMVASQMMFDWHYDKKQDVIDVLGGCKAIIAQNPRLQEQTKELLGKDNVYYIPNGVDEELFKPDNHFVVGFVGNKKVSTVDHKGYEVVKQACNELDVSLIEIKDNYPKGLKTHEEVRDFYKRIDCLAVLSNGEGCNNPTLECLSMNIPVIFTDQGISQELEARGLYMINRDVEECKEVLRHLVPRLNIIENYTWDKIAKQYKDLYVRYTGIQEEG